MGRKHTHTHFKFNDQNITRTPHHWSTPATTRPWPHFYRMCPILAIELAKSTRFSCPLPDNGHKRTGFSTNSPHTRAIPGSCSQLTTCSQLSKTTAFFQIVDSLQGSRLLVSLPLSLTHTQPANQTDATLSHTQHSSCDRPTMSDSTIKLAEKQCYPDTKALRTAVGEFFAHDSCSF